MKIFIITSLLLFVISATETESAETARRGNENNKNNKSNLAVMLAYKPKSEIRVRDENNKSWTYRMANDKKSASDEALNEKLMKLLTEQKLAKMQSKRDTSSSEENNDHEDDNVSENDAKIVEVNNNSNDNDDKKSCYRNTYKNVLRAFEDALKSQIENYKKCVCQKTTTTTTTTTTTEKSTTENVLSSESNESGDYDNLPGRSATDSDEALKLGNQNELALAAGNKNDYICIHKQYAFMLNKLLKKFKCSNSSGSSQPNSNNEPLNLNADNDARDDDEERSGKVNKRHNNNNNNANANVPNIKSNEFDESIELNVNDIMPKPTKLSKAITESRRDTAMSDDLRNQILGVLKEHFKLKKQQAKSTTTTTTTSTTVPSTIAPRIIVNDEIDSEEEFLNKLKKLFKEFEDETDQAQQESFQVSTRSHIEPKTSVPSQKPHASESNGKSSRSKLQRQQQRSGKSNNAENSHHKHASDHLKRSSRHSVVGENSNESAELSIKLKNAKYDAAGHSKSEKRLREIAANLPKKSASSSSKNSNKHASTTADAKRKSSKRNSNESVELKGSRTAPESHQLKNSPRHPSTKSTKSSGSNDNKYSYRTATRNIAEGNRVVAEEKTEKAVHDAENTSAHDDDRIASDLAQAISDLARKYLKV
jgi:hypothetical protein